MASVERGKHGEDDSPKEISVEQLKQIHRDWVKATFPEWPDEDVDFFNENGFDEPKWTRASRQERRAEADHLQFLSQRTREADAKARERQRRKREGKN